MSSADFIAPYLLHDRVTAVANGKTVPAVNAARDVTITFTSAGTTSGGTLIIEESDDPQYTGTWSQIESVAASSFTGTAKSAHHIRIGAGLYMRVRISAEITGGGTISITATGA